MTRETKEKAMSIPDSIQAERLDGKIFPVSVTYSPAKDSATISLRDGTRVFEKPTVFLLDRVTELLVQIDSDS